MHCFEDKRSLTCLTHDPHPDRTQRAPQSGSAASRLKLNPIHRLFAFRVTPSDTTILHPTFITRSATKLKAALDPCRLPSLEVRSIETNVRIGDAPVAAAQTIPHRAAAVRLLIHGHQALSGHTLRVALIETISGRQVLEVEASSRSLHVAR